MPILFSVVACEGNVLAKYASCEGNFTEIVEEVLSKIPPQNNKMTYSHGHYLLHYIIENKYVYFCITNNVCQRSRAFSFLNEIKRRFLSTCKEGFDSVLASEMGRYSKDYNTITIMKGELDELNSIGVGSSETLLGEKILFVENDENLSFSTISYVGKSPQRIIVSVENSYVIIIVLFVVLAAINIFGILPCCHFIILILAIKYILKT